MVSFRGRSHRAVCIQNLPETERCSTTNVLPEHGFLLRTPYVQLSGYQVGELSLAPEGECLSLHIPILAQEAKSGNAAPLYPPAKDSPFLPAHEGGDSWLGGLNPLKKRDHIHWVI
jgi:hypothetical protein